jgi:hypothetical protein
MTSCIVGRINNVTQNCDCVTGYVESEDFYSKSNCASVYNFTLAYAIVELVGIVLILLYVIYKNWDKVERTGSKKQNTPNKGIYIFLCFAVLTRIMWFIPGSGFALRTGFISGRSSVWYKSFWWTEYMFRCIVAINHTSIKNPLYLAAFLITSTGFAMSFPIPTTYTFFLSSVFHYTLACSLLIVIPINKPNNMTVEILVYTWIQRFFLALVIMFAYFGEYYNPADVTYANLFWFLALGVFVLIEE